MAEMNLSPKDRHELESLLVKRGGLQTPTSRQMLAEKAGVADVLAKVDLTAPADMFAWQLVSELQQLGTLDTTDQPALVSLVRMLRTLAKGHEDEVAFLDRLLAPYPLSQGEAPVPPIPAEPVPGPDRVTVLFLAANPRQTTALRLGEEVRTIEERLRESTLRERLDLRQAHAVRWTDVSRLLLEHQPHVVHFAGHGELGGELVFEDAVGQPWQVPVEALADLFDTLKDNIRCVVLNACWSKGQAQAIVRHIDCVVGMALPVPDDAAIRFAGGFYRGIGYGRDLRTAFKLGRNEMAVGPRSTAGRNITPDAAPSDIPDLGSLAEIPQLLTRPGVDPASTVLVRR